MVRSFYPVRVDTFWYSPSSFVHSIHCQFNTRHFLSIRYFIVSIKPFVCSMYLPSDNSLDIIGLQEIAKIVNTRTTMVSHLLIAVTEAIVKWFYIHTLLQFAWRGKQDELILCPLLLDQSRNQVNGSCCVLCVYIQIPISKCDRDIPIVTVIDVYVVWIMNEFIYLPLYIYLYIYIK